MTDADVVTVFRDAVWMTLLLAGPIMVVGLAVGVAVSLVQALTQIQEMTLAFVPKIVAIFVALVILMPWMLNQLIDLTSIVCHDKLFI